MAMRLDARRVVGISVFLLPILLMVLTLVYYRISPHPVTFAIVRYFYTYRYISDFCSVNPCSLSTDFALSQTLLMGIIVSTSVVAVTVFGMILKHPRTKFRDIRTLLLIVLFFVVNTSMGAGTAKYGGYGIGPQTLQGSIMLLVVDSIMWLLAFGNIAL